LICEKKITREEKLDLMRMYYYVLKAELVTRSKEWGRIK